MKHELSIMLDLQDKMNKKVHDDWHLQGFAWFRAIWIECGELVDHYGYKGWKKQTPDMPQGLLEVVDIWHQKNTDDYLKGEIIDMDINLILEVRSCLIHRTKGHLFIRGF